MSDLSFTKYNVRLIAWSLLFIASGTFSIWILNLVGHLPAPPLTATFCIDEKFKFMREAVARKPNLLAVGSSVTWRNLDFSTLRNAGEKSVRPLNGAPCYLKVHETAFLTDFYLNNIPSVQNVVTIFAMRDFEDCKANPAFFKRAAARRYVFDGWPAWHLYFLNFRPKLFFRDMFNIKEMRSGTDIRNPINMDSFGSSPLLITPPEVHQDVATTPECFDHLEVMARNLAARNITWSVVLMPPMPAWLKAYDPAGKRDHEWRKTIAKRLQGTGAILVDARSGPITEDRNFVDPAHLHWSSVPIFSAWAFQQIFREINYSSKPEMNNAL
jgi:hypothetical protein